MSFEVNFKNKNYLLNQPHIQYRHLMTPLPRSWDNCLECSKILE